MTVSSLHRFNSARHSYGVAQETKLKPILENYLGVPLIKTKQLYDSMDFISVDSTVQVELKSRSLKYNPANYSTWLLPACKGQDAKKKSKENKQIFFFYYWEATNELYVLEYDELLFSTFDVSIPEWHNEQQPHYYISRDNWTLI